VGAARLMRVVLDTNILFSALISQKASPHVIWEAWRSGHFELVTCSIQLEEIRRASRYPKFQKILKPHLVGGMVNRLKRAVIMDALSDDHMAADPGDSWLLALAEASRADYLVTGDKQAGLLSRRRVGSTRIVTAAAFCRTALREGH
jgi:putative PIN family toxin of toxin-antitoxin system